MRHFVLLILLVTAVLVWIYWASALSPAPFALWVVVAMINFLQGKPQIQIGMVEYTTDTVYRGPVFPLYRTFLSCWNERSKGLRLLDFLLPNRDAVDCDAWVKVIDPQVEEFGNLKNIP